MPTIGDVVAFAWANDGLSVCDESAVGFAQAVTGINASHWLNTDDITYDGLNDLIDKRPVLYYCGHGSGRGFLLGNRMLTVGDLKGRLGGQLQWLIVDACEALEEVDPIDRWVDCFDGTRAMVGYSRAINASQFRGPRLGAYLREERPLDLAWIHGAQDAIDHDRLDHLAWSVLTRDKVVARDETLEKLSSPRPLPAFDGAEFSLVASLPGNALSDTISPDLLHYAIEPVDDEAQRDVARRLAGLPAGAQGRLRDSGRRVFVGATSSAETREGTHLLRWWRTDPEPAAPAVAFTGSLTPQQTADFAKIAREFLTGPCQALPDIPAMKVDRVVPIVTRRFRQPVGAASTVSRGAFAESVRGATVVFRPDDLRRTGQFVTQVTVVGEEVREFVTFHRPATARPDAPAFDVADATRSVMRRAGTFVDRARTTSRRPGAAALDPSASRPVGVDFALYVPPPEVSVPELPVVATVHFQGTPDDPARKWSRYASPFSVDELTRRNPRPDSIAAVKRVLSAIPRSMRIM